ncbi:MAG: prepilin peptidase [Sedimentisphaerales bacterium]|nr:prepilin peptidase [Sedimentisphaerales bacterium]
MALPQWIWLIYTFAVGCCVGSFLNVVIYRLPKEKSLIKPGSFCPACNKHIRFYDNIPLISWLILGRKCRYCKAPISPRYFVIELLTGLMFVSTYYLFFSSPLRTGMPNFTEGGWLLYLLTIILLSALIASSAIDLELWIIPLSICWVVTAAGLIISAIAPIVIDPAIIDGYRLLPYASAKTSALAAGAAFGLGISLLLLFTGILKQSYEFPEESISKSEPEVEPKSKTEPRINHRLEVAKEVLFLLPIVVCSYAAYRLTAEFGTARDFWIDFSQKPLVAGLLGSVFGYFIGCGTVWATRILGTLGFGREAMGLGDVHLMGAVGAVIGPVAVVVAFFIAPFFGLGWAIFQMFFKKIRQIPYGPFLSIGTFVAIILHNAIYDYFFTVLGYK